MQRMKQGLMLIDAKDASYNGHPHSYTPTQHAMRDNELLRSDVRQLRKIVNEVS